MAGGAGPSFNYVTVKLLKPVTADCWLLVAFMTNLCKPADGGRRGQL